MTSTDSAGVLTLTDLNTGDLIDLSSLSALYDIEDVSLYHDVQQDNNYLAIADIPVFDVGEITELQVLIDSQSYDLSI